MAGSASTTRQRSAQGTRAPRLCFAVTGNCQAMFLASALNALPGAEAVFFAGPYRHVRFEGRAAATEPAEALASVAAAKRAAGAAVLFCEQTSPVAQPLDLRALGAEFDGTVRFPNVEAFALWPKTRYDEAQLARLTPERMSRLDRASNAASAAKADFGLEDVLDARFRTEILFDTPRHPSALLLAELVDRVLTLFDGFVPDADRIDLKRRVAASRGINTVFKYPIETALADALGCGWARADTYMDFRRAYKLLRQKNPEGARPILDRLLARVDDDFFARMIAPELWAEVALCHQRLGERAAAATAGDLAVACDPWNPHRHLIRARQHEADGELDEAAASLARAFELNPDGGQYLERLAVVRTRQGRTAEALQHLRDASGMKRTSADLWRRLAGLELDEAIAALERAGRLIGAGDSARRDEVEDRIDRLARVRAALGAGANGSAAREGAFEDEAEEPGAPDGMASLYRRSLGALQRALAPGGAALGLRGPADSPLDLARAGLMRASAALASDPRLDSAGSALKRAIDEETRALAAPRGLFPRQLLRAGRDA